MKCEDIQDKMPDFLDNNLAKETSIFMEKHIESCTKCSKEHSEMRKLFFELSEDAIEHPSTSLTMNFEEMLAVEKAKQERSVVQLHEKTSWKSYLRIAASILIVVSAFIIGQYSANNNGSELASSEILAQVKSQSASQRIAALTITEDLNKYDTEIIQAFINRLLYDDKPSVRLAAVEALTQFTSLDMVKDALIKSLETDMDPAIQIELIRVLADIQEKRALSPMKKLLNNETVPDYVKKEVQINIARLS